MNVVELPPTDRRRAARTAVDALGAQRSDHVLVRVTCPASHHVATVYKTEEGPVVVTASEPHASGSRDFVDNAHHGGSRGSEYADMVQATRFEDDDLPAWCSCGTHTLSRAELQKAIASHTRTLSVTT
ncbi:hypothetical protein ACFVAV_00465 [Nocardia sp. NPDC057663]|uniref:hypothetical protein n=1 Tax=Nocardia sp. NPDC057663 TaxID=3346201 RepID=UPI00366CAC78